MPEWLIYHYDEFLQPVGSFKPMLNSVVWDIETGVSIDYEIAYSDPMVTRDCIAPKRTIWELYNYGFLIDKGIHSNRNLKSGRGTIKIQGRSYLWYLDNRVYPFDVRNIIPYSPGRQSTWTDETRKSIVTDLINAIQVNVVPNPITSGGFFASAYSYSMGVTGDAGGITNYQFDFADTRSIMQHIKDLASAEDGFDWRFDPVGMNLVIGSPSFDDGSPVFTFDYTLGTPDPLIDIEWDDDGPEATFTYGLGAGTQNRQFGWMSTYEPSLQTYRRWDKVEDFGEVKNLNQIKTRTAHAGLIQRYPMKRITVTINGDPNDLLDFWTSTRPRNLIGRRFHVRYDFTPFHLIDSAYIITNLSLKPSKDGDVQATLTGDIVNI